MTLGQDDSGVWPEDESRRRSDVPAGAWRDPATRRLMLLVFLVALALRSVYFVQLSDSPFFDSPLIDAYTFHERAVELARYGRWHEDEVFWQPPLYPYALGALYAITGPQVGVARAVQLVLGAAVCALFALLALRLHGRTAAWVAGLLTAGCGTLIFFEGELLNPVLSLALNVGALLVLVPPGEADGRLPRAESLTPARWLAAGCLLGMSAIARPDVLPFAGIVAIAPLFDRAAPTLLRLGRTALFVAAVALPILPVTLHNRVFGGEWVPISANFGINLYLGNSTEAERTLDIRPGLEWQQLVEEPSRDGVPSDSASGHSAWFVRRTFEAVREAPDRWLGDLVGKAWLVVSAAETGRNLDPRFVARDAPILRWLPSWGWILPLGLVGMALAVRARRDTLLLVYLGNYCLALLLFFVSARYRLPMIPVLSVFAGFAVARVAGWWRDGRRRPVAIAAAAALLVGAVSWMGAGGDLTLGPHQEADGHYLRAMALARRGDHEAALVELEKVLAIEPRHWDALFDAAAALTELGQPRPALALYRQILDHHPEDTESLAEIVRLLRLMGRGEEAVSILIEVGESERGTPQSALGASRALFMFGRSSDALRIATAASRRAPAFAPLAIDRDRMERALDAKARLVRCLDLPAEADASEGEASVGDAVARAEASLERGEHLEAEVLAAEALTGEGLGGCSESAAAWALLGKLWQLRADPLAPAALRRAVALDPELADAHYGLALALASDPDRRAEAVAALERYLELAPRGSHAERARRALSAVADSR